MNICISSDRSKGPQSATAAGVQFPHTGDFTESVQGKSYYSLNQKRH